MRIGIGVADITPPPGIELAGYYYKRYAQDIHDRLYVRTLFLDDGLTRTAVIVCDVCYLGKGTILFIRDEIRRLNILPFENVIVCATHTHTGPVITPEHERYLVKRILESLQNAHEGACEGRLQYGVSHVEGICFNRRYFMKDGSVVTNPVKCDPDILKPAGPAPTEIQIVSIDRINKIEGIEKSKRAVMVNFALHPDTVAGTVLSADYPYFIESEIVKTLGNISEVIFTNGTGGDINHWDVKNPDPQRGFAEAERIGRTIGAVVASELDRVKSVRGDHIRIEREKVKLPYIKVSDEETASAREVLKKPYPEGVDFTMEVVEARKILRVSELQGEFNEIEITAIGIGDLVLVGVPAELFVELGMEIKDSSPFKNTIIIDLAYENVGYIATEKSCKEGGYEAASSIYEPEAGIIVVDSVLRMLKRLYLS